MGTTDIGAQLRASREALGLSIASLAQRTRVQPRIIAAIEQNDLSAIPPKPYGRGFIRAYAREVGLDPERAVQDYFAQFTPGEAEIRTTPEPQPWPARGSWLVTAGTVAATLVLAALFQGDRTDAVDPRAPAAVGTSGSAAEPRPAADADALEPASRAAVPAQSAQSRDADTPAGAALALVLQANRHCWVTATADGKRVIYELMKPGAKQTIRADREVRLRAGDAGALRVTVNGQSSVFGADGEVRTARFAPQPAPNRVP